MGRYSGNSFLENKKRKEFLIIAGVAGAGLLGLAALGVAKKGGGSGAETDPLAILKNPPGPDQTQTITISPDNLYRFNADTLNFGLGIRGVNSGLSTSPFVRNLTPIGDFFTTPIDTGLSTKSVSSPAGYSNLEFVDFNNSFGFGTRVWILGDDGSGIFTGDVPLSGLVYLVDPVAGAHIFKGSKIDLGTLGNVSKLDLPVLFDVIMPSSGEIRPTLDASFHIGDATHRFLDINVVQVISGATNLTLTPNSAVVPLTNNSKDLGTTTLRWRSIFIGTSAVFDNTATAIQLKSTFPTRTGALQFLTTGNGTINLRGDGSTLWVIDGDTLTDIYGIGVDSKNFFPAVDNVSDLGTTTLSWKIVRARQFLLKTSGGGFVGFDLDANDQIELVGCPDIRPSADMCADIGSDTKRIDAFIGPNWRNTGTSPSGLTMVSSSFSLLLDDPGFSFRPDTFHENTVDLGIASARWRTLYLGTSLQILGAASDANPKVKLTDTGLFLGAGGASATDTYYARISANTAEVSNSIQPNSDNNYNLGSSTGPKRWNTVYTLFVSAFSSALTLNGTGSVNPGSDNALDLGTSALRWKSLYLTGASLHMLGAASDANDTTTLKSGELDFGPGGATAVDTKFIRVDNQDMKFVSNNVDMLHLTTKTITTQTPWMRVNTGNGNLIINAGSNGLNGSVFINFDAGSGSRGLVVGSPASNRPQTQGALYVDHAVGIGLNDSGTVGQLAMLSIINKYNNITTAGFGVPAIVGEGDLTGQTGTVASVTAYTVGAANGVFKVGGDLDVTAFTSGTINLQVTYTDWNSGAQTITIDSANALADFLGNEVTIMAKASTSITIKTTGTFTLTYNVAATITQYK